MLRASTFSIFVILIGTNMTMIPFKGAYARYNSIKILLWHPPNCTNCRPFDSFGSGNHVFTKCKCNYTNCFIYNNYEDLSSIRNETSYDAIIFNGRNTGVLSSKNLPKRRLRRQIYIFAQVESSDRFPVCQNWFDDFFNWTMTFRLNSDIPWPYFKINTIDNKTIGPKDDVPWLKPHEMDEIDYDYSTRLSRKTRIAAWFVSNCHTAISGREEYVRKLSDRLNRLSRQTVDIYGACGTLLCPKRESVRCNHMLEKRYMFYLAMENSFDKDYVTEKLVTAQQHDTIPVVFGDADYSKFAPPGSYLNAKKYHPYKLAAIMSTLYKRRARYYDFFRWRNHYYYVDTSNVTSMVACKLCAKLNQNRRNQYKGEKAYKHFRQWWNENFINRCEQLRKTTTTTTTLKTRRNQILVTTPSFRYIEIFI